MTRKSEQFQKDLILEIELQKAPMSKKFSMKGVFSFFKPV
jgi:hypothetical protein